MKLVYIAGPYSAPNAWQRESNIRAAESQSIKLWRVGVPAVCVHTMARHFYGEVSEAYALAIDDAILLRCDAVLLCPGWATSAGTRREVEMARAMGMPVWMPDQVEDCIMWASEDDP